MTAHRLPLYRPMTRALACAMTCAATALPAPLHAQEPVARAAAAAGGRDSALLGSLAMLRSRQRLAADAGGRGLISGRYLGHDADTLWIKTGSDAASAVPVERIRTLYVQRGTCARPFAVAGALLIAPIGMIGAGIAWRHGRERLRRLPRQRAAGGRRRRWRHRRSTWRPVPSVSATLPAAPRAAARALTPTSRYASRPASRRADPSAGARPRDVQDGRLVLRCGRVRGRPMDLTALHRFRDEANVARPGRARPAATRRE